MTSQIGYLKLLITRSILSGPLDFEIKRVACRLCVRVLFVNKTQCKYLLTLLYGKDWEKTSSTWRPCQPCRRCQPVDHVNLLTLSTCRPCQPVDLVNLSTLSTVSTCQTDHPENSVQLLLFFVVFILIVKTA